MAKKSKRATYSDEQKEKAVSLHFDRNKTYAEIAKDFLGNRNAEKTVRRWCDLAQKENSKAFAKKVDVLKSLLKQHDFLEKEVEQLIRAQTHGDPIYAHKLSEIVAMFKFYIELLDRIKFEQEAQEKISVTGLDMELILGNPILLETFQSFIKLYNKIKKDADTGERSKD